MAFESDDLQEKAWLRWFIRGADAVESKRRVAGGALLMDLAIWGRGSRPRGPRDRLRSKRRKPEAGGRRATSAATSAAAAAPTPPLRRRRTAAAAAPPRCCHAPGAAAPLPSEGGWDLGGPRSRRGVSVVAKASEGRDVAGPGAGILSGQVPAACDSPSLQASGLDRWVADRYASDWRTHRIMSSRSLPGTRAVRITADEHRTLRRIFRWRLTYWLTFAATVPAVALSIRLVQGRGWHAVIALPVAVLALHALARHRVVRARCPRCHELFFDPAGVLGSAGTTLPTPRRCQRCALRYEAPATTLRSARK
ncbi:MAG: hypothetical protein HYV63_30675 [Candidatus Schekmanbacteria bacterium]|nr:hypothetical protein [Candidatus Schekmanbacteria bacterium]